MIGLVLGGAACVWDDLETAQQMLGDRERVMVAANDVGMHIDGDFHWCTLHAEHMPGWEAERAARGLPRTYTTWGRTYPYGEEHLQALTERAVEHGMGSSGMLAVEVAVHLGCAPILLCGVPLDDSPHFFDAAAWAHASGFRRHWERRAQWLRERHVRSMSGWTRDLLGGPTAGWIDSAA